VSTNLLSRKLMDIVRDPESAWTKAQDTYLASLTPSQIRSIRSITTQSELLNTTKEYRRRYNSRGFAKLLDRVNPFLAQLHSFSDIIKTYVSSDPKFATLVWGSVTFVLEVCYPDQLAHLVVADAAPACS
jgi:hypothetical protein